MESNINAVKALKPRTVFGRREAEVEAKTWRFEMRVDGVHVRRKRSRKVRVLNWTDLVHASIGQGLLKL